MAAANRMRSIGINYQLHALFVAQDVDATVALMCYIQLSLLGCAGYVVIGNTLTEPQVGSALFGEDSSRCWFTPMYYHEVWQTRRAIAQVEAMFRAVATPIPEAAAAETADNMPGAGTAGKPLEAPSSAPEPEKAPDYTPTFIISTRKKNAGQMMFDFE